MTQILNQVKDIKLEFIKTTSEPKNNILFFYETFWRQT